LGVADDVGSGEGDEGGFKYAINATIAANTPQDLRNWHIVTKNLTVK
jgi:hypothetical protein